MFFEVLTDFISVVGKVSAANAQATSAAFNARISRFNAGATREAGRIKEERIRRAGRKRAGQIRANVGASGFDMEGSAADVLSESIFNAEQDAMLTRITSQQQARGQEMEAELFEQQARGAKRAGFIGAASTLLASKQFTGKTDTTFSLGGGTRQSNTTMLSTGETIVWN